jgi:DNA-binding transcriptional regulator YhcF (GntR family)
VSRPALSAKDIKEAIQERVLRGLYSRGAALPSVRELGAELGASPSTVSRALQELEREGWIQIATRRGAVVSRQLPRSPGHEADIEATLRRLATRWRLSGRDRAAFRAMVDRVQDDVFRSDSVVYFLECNPVDLARMVDEVRREASEHRLEPLLIDDARADPTRLLDSVVLVPFFHLADVRTFLPKEIEIVPLNFVPSEEVMRTLAHVDEQSHVGVIALNERSRRRLEGIVHQYSVARPETATIDQTEEVDRLLRTADVIVTANSAGLTEDQLAIAANALIINFELERGELDLTRLLLQARNPRASTQPLAL